MRIAFLLDQFPCLSETFILNQVTGLIDLGHDVAIYALSPAVEKITHRDVDRYRLLDRTTYIRKPSKRKSSARLQAFAFLLKWFLVHPFRTFRYLKVLRSRPQGFSYSLMYLVFTVGRKPLDVLQCHYGPVGNLGVYIRKCHPRMAFATMFHGYDIRLGLQEGPALYRDLFAHCDAILSISNYNRTHLLKWGAPESRLIHHPVGIDTQSFAPAGDRPSEATTPIVLLSIGRLVPEKGFSYALQAIARVVADCPEVKFRYDIVGGGPLRDELIAQIEQFRLQEYVRLVGAKSQDQIRHHLNQAHGFLLPSIAEALPIVVMEAQAAQLPVIATSVGSVAELVHENVNGCLVAPADSDALAKKIAWFLGHPGLWSEMGRRGNEHVRQCYDIHNLNRSLEALYRDVLQQIRSGHDQ